LERSSSLFGRGLRALSIATVVFLATALALVFFYAPIDADQGFVQKIFYVHVPLAIIALLGWILAGAYAKGSWGKWWVWDEPTLVSFLIVFLLYVTYYPLRYSIEDPERRARYSSVFAITAGAFVPINFIAVRLSESLVHPRVLSATGGSMPGEMRLTFLISLAGMALLYFTLFKLELTAKHSRRQLRRLRRLLEDDGPEPSRSSPLSTVPAKPE
jgi:heme exporter protein C